MKFVEVGELLQFWEEGVEIIKDGTFFSGLSSWVGAAIHEPIDENKNIFKIFEEEMIQIIECNEWEKIINNWWFIVSNLNGLKKCRLAYLKWRDRVVIRSWDLDMFRIV